MRHHLTAAMIATVGLTATTALAATGRAAIHGTAEGSPIAGTATLADTPQGLKISVQVTGVPPGDHGIHIHEFGACEDLGKAAGSHFNPDGSRHGFLPKDGAAGAHSGDMGNITVGADGTGVLDVVLPGTTLTDGPHAVAGRAIILHEKLDDFGQPTGNAGGRIGCGKIEVQP